MPSSSRYSGGMQVTSLTSDNAIPASERVEHGGIALAAPDPELQLRIGANQKPARGQLIMTNFDSTALTEGFRFIGSKSYDGNDIYVCTGVVFDNGVPCVYLDCSEQGSCFTLPFEDYRPNCSL